MRVVWPLILAAILLGGCGIKRALVRPSEIPAYEQRIEKKQHEHEQFKREQQAQQPQI